MSTTMEMRGPAFLLLEVPEGRYIVAHRFNGGVREVRGPSPVGATQGSMCRPYGAEKLSPFIPHR